MRTTRRAYSRCMIAMTLLLASCVADPDQTTPPLDGMVAHGVVVVNEGLHYQDNSSLTLYEPGARTVVQDWFARANPGQRLGDTGNDIVVRGDVAYVVVSTSQNIEVVELSSGRSRGRVRVGGGDPRKLAFVNDSVAYVTLLEGDAVLRFDPRALATGSRHDVGPAPEGIVALRGRMFVANSGKGNLRRREPKAGTVSVLSANDGSEMMLLTPGPNPVAIEADTARGIVYVQWGMPHADSAGGVVAYDAGSLLELGRWTVTGCGVAGAMALDAVRSVMYIVTGDGALSRIDLASGDSARHFAATSPPSPLGFYGIGVAQADGRVYASSVTHFSLPATVVVFDRDGSRLDAFEAGLNPSSFGFF